MNSKRVELSHNISIIKSQLNSIDSVLNKLTDFTNTIATKKDFLSADIGIYPDHIQELETYYANNNFFIKGISINDNNGNVFNLYRDKNYHFIKDVFKARLIKSLITQKKIIDDKQNYYHITPIFYGDTLIGNLSVSLDIPSFFNNLFKFYIYTKNQWPTAVLDSTYCLTFPLSEKLTLSGITNLYTQIQHKKDGFLINNLSGEKQPDIKVLSCYQPVFLAESTIGIILSENISPLIRSTWKNFIFISIISLFFSIVVLIIYLRITRQQKKINTRQVEIIKKNESIFDNIPLGIMLVNSQNNLYAINKVGLTLLKDYLSINDIGKNIKDINLPSGFINGELSTEYADFPVFRFEIHDKEMCFYKNTFTLNSTDNIYQIETFLDISPIDCQCKQEIRANLTKSEVLSRISKDFKKPLANIEDAITLFQQEAPTQSTLKELQHSTDALNAIMDDMADFANIEADLIVLNEIPYSPIDEIKKIFKQYLPIAQKKGLKLQTFITCSISGNIIGDPDRFKQIVSNLVSNAIKFTAEGEVRINLEAIEKDNEMVELKCSIEDTGQGMSANQIKNIFSIDVRAKESSTSAIGLGVIICKKLIERMGGTIYASSPSLISTSKKAPGTEFCFTIQGHMDKHIEKECDYTNITNYSQIQALLISTNVKNTQFLGNYLLSLSIQSDRFIYNEETADLLINKLIIDKDRYQLIFLQASNDNDCFKIAEKMSSHEITKYFTIVIIPYQSIKGNYLKARTLGVDYYLNEHYELSEIDTLIKTSFPQASIEEIPRLGILRKNISILIAENNILSQKIALVIFKNLGYQIEVVQNRLDLLNKLENHSFDIIFIDLKFPPTNGLEITETIRQKGFQMPIIAMTSNQSKNNIKQILHSGITGYISKPIKIDSIRNTLFQWFASSN